MKFDHYTKEDLEYEVVWAFEAENQRVISECGCYAITREGEEYILSDGEANEWKRFSLFADALYEVGMGMMLAEAKATSCCVDSFLRHGRRRPKHFVDGHELVEFPW